MRSPVYVLIVFLARIVSRLKGQLIVGLGLAPQPESMGLCKWFRGPAKVLPLRPRPRRQ